MSRWLSLVVVGVAVVLVSCQGEPSQTSTYLSPPNQKRLRKAQQALGQNQFQEALGYLDTLTQQTAGSADVFFLYGRIYTALGQYKKANKAYRKSLELQPHYPGAWNNIANNAYRQRKYEKAIPLYRRELENNPAPRPWRGMGRAYVQLHKVDSAQAAFEQALQIDSTYAPVHFSLALLYENEGYFNKALHHIRRARQQQPANTRYRYLLGSLLFNLGQTQKAIAHLRYVCDQWPWYNSAYYKLGQALAQQGKQEQGQKYIARAEELRELQEEISYYEQSVRSKRNNPLAHAKLASAYRMAGRYKDAMAAYRNALYLDPKNLAVRNNVALLHVLMDNQQQAIKEFKHIVQEQPEHVDAWVNLGTLYARAGNHKQAAKAWQQALTYKPNHQQAKAYLAKLKNGTFASQEE